MNHLDRPTFEQCALASGLLTPSQLDEARAGIRWSEGDEPDAASSPSDKQIADRLVETGLLNAWQAKQLLDGRTKFNLGPYQIIDSIGQGGMGQVFMARHEKIGRVVAVKVLPLDKSTPEAVASFTREIRALARLDHPKLVAALDAGEDGSVHYLVTEFVPGMDLRKLVRRDGPLSMSAAASIISQVAEGLEYAHDQGIVHRDVKPGNVLVSPQGDVKLLDLGLAGPLTGEHESDPRHGKIVGTADYLSPDHVRDPWNPAPAWDIYSLGCTLYYAATGKVPYPGGTTADKARAHCDLRPLDPRRLNQQLSDEFVEVMADMMAKEPARRIGSAQEVIARLATFLSGVPLAPTVPLAEPVPHGEQPVPHAAAGPLAEPVPHAEAVPLAEPVPHGEQPVPHGEQPVPHGEQPSQSHPQSADESGSSSSRILETAPRDLMAVLWPLTMFFLAPLALMGAVWLLWMLVRTVLR